MTTAIQRPNIDAHDHLSRARSVEVDPVVDIVVPVHNEEVDLGPSVRRLDSFLAEQPPVLLLHHHRRQRQHRRHLVGGSGPRGRTDPGPGACTLIRKAAAGRSRRSGRRRRRRSWPTWTSICPPICGPCCPLVAPLISGHSDIAIGSRLARSSRVVRGPKREFISRSYNLILKGALAASFSDAQCGFKAIRASVADELLPLVAGQQLVLRHRTAGDRAAGRPADPRGAGGLDRRPGQPGQHRRHREGGSGRCGAVDQGLHHRRHPGGPAAGRA